MSAADDIKAKLDIVSYIQQYAPLKKAGRTYKACCPFHSEKTPSFVVNPDTQTWRCFGACAVGGDVISFAMKKNSWSFTEALQELGRQVGIEVQPRTPVQKARDDAHDQLRGMLQSAAEIYHQHLLNPDVPDAVATLKYAQDKRGFREETIRRFMIGYAPTGWRNMLDYLVQLGYNEDQIIEVGLAVRNEKGNVYDRFRNRLMIPIRDDRGRIVGFGARALDPEDSPKYLNSPQTPVFDKSHVLFGLDYAKTSIRDSETAVIVEGYMDAIQAHQAGFTNVIAQMGTALTDGQLQLIAPRYAKKIILALDSDAAGQNATLRSLEVARQTLQADYTGKLAVEIRILQTPGAKDPDDFIRESPQSWQELVDAAVPVADFVIEMETATLPPNATLQMREGAARRLLPMLMASENNLYNKDNIQKLALKLHISERDLLEWSNEQRKIEVAKAPRGDNRSMRGQEPPEPPPLDYDNMGLPSDFDVRTLPARNPMGAAPSREVALEAFCLKVLLTKPEMLYQVNRMFRQLGSENPDLQRGPLGDLCPEDFIRGECRGLMHVFLQAIEQDSMDAVDFIREQLDEDLLLVMDALLRHEFEDVSNRVRNRMSADIGLQWKLHEKFVAPMVDMSAELLLRTLVLRSRRLQREREELRFLQMDAIAQGADDEVQQYTHQIMLSMQAKRLIEVELRRQSDGVVPI